MRGQAAAAASAAGKRKASAAGESSSSSSDSSSDGELEVGEQRSAQRVQIVKALTSAKRALRGASQNTGGPRAALRKSKQMSVRPEAVAARLASARAAVVFGSAPRSFSTLRAALRSWFDFARLKLGRVDKALPPSTDELALYSLECGNPRTFSNYRGALLKICAFLELDISGFNGRVAECIKPSIKKRAPVPPKPKHDIQFAMLRNMLPEVGNTELSFLFLASFAFASRLPSEAIPMQRGGGRSDGAER